jgi:hypothetical protein
MMKWNWESIPSGDLMIWQGARVGVGSGKESNQALRACVLPDLDIFTRIPKFVSHQGLVAVRGVTSRFVSRNSTHPFPTIALTSRCPPWRILFLLHRIKLLVNYFQFNSLEQNIASLISEFS